jgi:Tfp pilus assembly protein PilZ
VNIIKAKYRDGQAFLRAYQENFLHGGIFVPTRKKIELGTSVVADVRFPDLRNTLMIRGIIAWRRAGKRRTKLRAGLGLEFLASESKKRDFLVGVANGQIVDIIQRRHRRLPVEIRVDWRGKSDRSWQISSVEDIGEGGAFIRTTSFQPVGSSVILEITAPGGERKIPIEGVIAWTCHTPDEEGMGVEFRCRDLGGARRLKELVRRIERMERRFQLSVAS